MLYRNPCTVDDCGRFYYAKGLCAMHYARWRKTGVIGAAKSYYRERKFDSLANHPLKDTWYNIFQRCYNPKNTSYASYGGRDIRVCERWNSFANFIADIGDKPSAEHTLDRINNDGNYEPSNIRWATRKEQQLNRRAVDFSGRSRDWHGRYTKLVTV